MMSRELSTNLLHSATIQSEFPFIAVRNRVQERTPNELRR